MLPSERILKTHVSNALKQGIFRRTLRSDRLTLQNFVNTVIIEYFDLTLNLHRDTVRGTNTLIELQNSTFGIIHISATATTQDLTKNLVTSLNTLTQDNPTQRQQSYRYTLEREILNKWAKTQLCYAQQFSGFQTNELPSFQKEQIERYQTMSSSGPVSINLVPIFQPTHPFSLINLHNMQRNLFLSVYILLYLEYIFSVSSAPRNRMELLEIIYTHSQFLDKSIAELMQNQVILIKLKQHLHAKDIETTHLQAFFETRVSNKALLAIIFPLVQKHQFDIEKGIPQLVNALQSYPLTHLVTDQFAEFNSGTSLLYIGHQHTLPPNLVGLIGTLIDCACDFEPIEAVNIILAQLFNGPQLMQYELENFSHLLHQLAQTTLHIADKQKLVETYRPAFFPWHQRFIENHSAMNEAQQDFIQTLLIETSFTHLFSTTDAAAQRLATIKFNHIALRVLRENQGISFDTYITLVQEAVLLELNQPINQTHIDNQLPLLWGLQNSQYELMVIFNSSKSFLEMDLKTVFEHRKGQARQSPTANLDAMRENSDKKASALAEIKALPQRVLQRIIPINQQTIGKKLFDGTTVSAFAGATLGVILAATGAIPPIGASIALCIFVAAVVGIITGIACKAFLTLLHKKSHAQQSLYSAYHSNESYAKTASIENLPVNSYAKLGILTPGTKRRHPQQQPSATRQEQDRPYPTLLFNRIHPINSPESSDDDDTIYEEHDRLTFF